MHVPVLGAGYAGVTLTRLLERRLPADVELTLVDESTDHVVQQELHRLVRRPELAEEITIPLTELVDRATVRTDRVEAVDAEAGVVHLADGELAYDVGAVCLGAETAFYGIEGLHEHATPLKRIDDAREIRAETLAAFDRGDPRIVVGGAGLSGVQVAGELAELAREEDVEATVTLLEARDRVAPAFPANFGERIAAVLAERGVTVRTGSTVAGVDAERVALADGGSLPADVVVWTGGIRGSDALAGERPTVRGDLRLADRTFACGDAARVVDADGQPAPASAQTAVRQARVVAENVSRLVEYERDGGLFEPRLARYRYESPGWLVSVGDDAVAQLGPAVFTGRAAKAAKATVAGGYLSSIGAIREAVELVGEEFDGSRPERPT